MKIKMKLIIKIMILCFFIVAIFVTIFALNKDNNIEHFFAKNFINFSTAFKVNVPGINHLNSNRMIDSPPLTWITLLEIHALRPNSTGIITTCLVYKVPYISTQDSSLGVLRVIEIKNGENCLDKYDQNIISQLDNISSLLGYLYDQQKNIEGFKEEVDPFTLVLKVKQSNLEEKILKFPFMNLTRSKLLFDGQRNYKSDLVQERFRSMAVKRGPYTGVLTLALNKKLEKQKELAKEFLSVGGIEDSYLLKNAILCYGVDKDCREVKQNSCHLCRYGSFEVITQSVCSRGGSRFCGVNKCGTSGNPACLRGLSLAFEFVEDERVEEASLDIANDKNCIEQQKRGFCNVGLYPVCDEHGILVCQ